MENKPQAVQEWALGPIEGGQKNPSAEFSVTT